jgi:hypothetical protein
MIGGQPAARMSDRHSFPVGGLVELSRATYQSTPLAVVEIRPTVFSFIGATSRDRVQKLKSAQEAVAERRLPISTPSGAKGSSTPTSGSKSSI